MRFLTREEVDSLYSRKISKFDFWWVTTYQGMPLDIEYFVDRAISFDVKVVVMFGCDEKNKSYIAKTQREELLQKLLLLKQQTLE